jgi:hypothetical protein
MSAPFGVGGRTRRKTHAYVEEVPRICVYDLRGVARSLFTPRACEGVEATTSTIRVVINGRPETIDVVCDARHLGGVQQYFLCWACSRRVWHLYLRADERPMCRKCAGNLDYRSQHTHRRGLNGARRLREKIGALPSPLAPLPPRPRYVRRDYWMRAVAKVAAAEAVIAAQLHAIVPRVRQRLKRT